MKVVFIVSFLALVGCAAAPAPQTALTPLEQLRKDTEGCEKAYGGGTRALFYAPYTPTTRAEYEKWELDAYLKQLSASNKCNNRALKKWEASSPDLDQAGVDALNRNR
jgi:hypothetical protein